MTDTAKTQSSRRFARTPKTGASDPSTAIAAAETTVSPAPATAAVPKPASKIAHVIGLLKREEGATLAELMAVTGWQPHTTRAALTGLRKKGHAIERMKRDEMTSYRIAAEA